MTCDPFAAESDLSSRLLKAPLPPSADDERGAPYVVSPALRSPPPPRTLLMPLALRGVATTKDSYSGHL